MIEDLVLECMKKTKAAENALAETCREGNVDPTLLAQYKDAITEMMEAYKAMGEEYKKWELTDTGREELQAEIELWRDMKWPMQ